MGNRTSIQREAGQPPEIYGYDYAQQSTAGVEGGNAHTYGYDANGNRTAFDGGGTYVTNLLNQQTTFNGVAVSYNNANGNVDSVGSLTSYVYDAQNRLTSVNINGVISTFNYDGLNRKISQTVAGVTTYNVWDGWSLIEERGTGNTLLNTYVYGADEIVERITGTTASFYYQDGLGSTSHVSDASGNLLEFYKYTTFGLPAVYAPDGSSRKNGSTIDVRHLYTGQLWMPKGALFDHRNRVYSPTLTRFLQSDPIGFNGDATNLYRYSGNNAVNWSDPSGLGSPEQKKLKDDSTENYYNGERYTDELGGSEFYGDTTGRFGVGGLDAPPEPGTTFGPGEGSPNDGGYGNGNGSGGGGNGRNGRGGGAQRGGNPYLGSGPFMAELAPGFQQYNLPAHAAFWEEYAQWVPSFLPLGGGTVGSGLRPLARMGLMTPSRYFGSKTVREITEALTRKFGPPRSVRPGAQTFFNPRTRRSFNIHIDPAHGKPHVDIRRRGGYRERQYFLEE